MPPVLVLGTGNVSASARTFTQLHSCTVAKFSDAAYFCKLLMRSRLLLSVRRFLGVFWRILVELGAEFRSLGDVLAGKTPLGRRTAAVIHCVRQCCRVPHPCGAVVFAGRVGETIRKIGCPRSLFWDRGMGRAFGGRVRASGRTLPAPEITTRLQRRKF